MYDFQVESKKKLFNSRWLECEIGNDSNQDYTYYLRLYHVKSKREFILKDKKLIEVGLGQTGIDWEVVIKNPNNADVETFISNINLKGL